MKEMKHICPYCGHIFNVWHEDVIRLSAITCNACGFSHNPSIPNQVFQLEEENINHPSHYTSHPSGVECIVITEHMNFCLGNAMKYLWRAGLKGDSVEDLKKAIWYINREIERIKDEKSR